MDSNEPATPPVVSQPPTLRIISGFWRRSIAFFIDCMVLGVFGLILGGVLFDFFAHLGPWGRLVGLAIALAYFGVLNSGLGGGRTVGKRLMGIEVINASGHHISVGRSLLRFLIIGAPFFPNGAELLLNTIATIVSGLLVFGLGGSIVYLFIFNRPTRQSVHDLAVGTYVVRRESSGVAAAARVWSGHLVIVASGCVLLVIGMILGGALLSKVEPLAKLLAVRKDLLAGTHVCNASVVVSRNWTLLNGQSRVTTSLQSSVVLDKRPVDYQTEADKAAATLLADYPDVLRDDILSVTVIYGYDLGIAHWWISRSFRGRPTEWAAKLRNSGSQI